SHADLMRKGGIYARLMAEQARAAEAEIFLDETREQQLQGQDALLQPLSAAAPTGGILKAQGLNWYQLAGKLMQLVMPWKGRLAATFLLGIARVLAFIGVGVTSALIVLALKNGEDYRTLLWVLAVVAPLAGILHWLESWIAHDMAFRLLRSEVRRVGHADRARW